MLTNYLTIPNPLWKNIHETGSNYICNPPITDTDIDYIIFSDNKDLLSWLEEQGFYPHNDDYPLEIDGLFISLKKENLNLIITDQFDFYLKFVNATKLAKKLNLLKKEDRILLFQFVLYNALPKEESPFDNPS